MQGPKPLLISLCLAASVALASGCGDEQPEPSIPLDDATTLASTLEEIQANVDVGSCTVASGKVQEFQEEVAALPPEVNSEVADALDRGAQNLLGLIDEQCDQPEEETTTEETTTEETTTEETTTEETTTEETQTTTPTVPTTPPPNTGGGGVGPPGSDGL